MRILLIFLLLGAFSCSTEKVNKEENIATVTAKSGLNMRMEPHTDARIISILPYGTKSKILDHLGDYEKIGKVAARWKKIIYKKKIGWVYSRYFLNEKIRQELMIVPDEEIKKIPQTGIDLYKTINIKGHSLYNATKTNIPVYKVPSKKSLIIDYLQPQAWIYTKKKAIITRGKGKIEEWYYDQEVGWIQKFLLIKLPIEKTKRQMKKVLRQGLFFNISERLGKKARKALDSGKRYDYVIKYILPKVAYFDISWIPHLSIALFMGAGDNLQSSIDGNVRQIMNKGKLVKVSCYGNNLYPKFLSVLYTDSRVSSEMPNKNSKRHMFTLELEIIDKRTIKFKGQTYTLGL